MKKFFTAFAVVLSLVGVIVWQLLSSQVSYYLVSVAVLFLAMLPFLISFERSEKTAGELALVAGLTALAVVGRVAFYLIPQIKPIAAVVGVTGACLGAKKGYITGCLSMFVSNFVFGQGVWTPFQMMAMGLVGLVFGVLFDKVKPRRLLLAATGFISVFFVYGLVADMASVLFLSSDLSVKSIAAVYIAGLPFNAMFSGATALFLFLFGEQFVEKIKRITTKYGI